MKKPVCAVIYAFQSPASRSVYVGKHQVSEGDLRSWPSEGYGRLPSGYRGSGLVVQRVHAKHKDRVRWRILARVTGSMKDVNAAERRAIRLARRVFGPLCLNLTRGGDGFSSDDWLERYADPAFREARAQQLRAMHADPAASERRKAAARSALQSPEVKARMAVARQRLRDDPDVQRRRLENLRAALGTDEARANARSRFEKLRACPETEARRREAHAAPDVRERMREASARRAASEEGRVISAKAGMASQKKRREDPEHGAAVRAKQSKSMAESHARRRVEDPEGYEAYRLKLAAAQKAASWRQDPEKYAQWQARQSAAHKARAQTPEGRAALEKAWAANRARKRDATQV